MLLSVLSLAVAVGRHPGQPGTLTTFPAVGRFDGRFFEWMQPLHLAPLTWLALVLNLVGSGWVSAPMRVVALGFAASRRMWRAFWAVAATWALAEVAATLLKNGLERSRPPDAIVHTSGFSFPSGHATAAASLVVSLVLTFLPPGPERRRWEVAAGIYVLAMAFSRVYLNAHWFSDALAGAILGTGLAIICSVVAGAVVHRRTLPETRD